MGNIARRGLFAVTLNGLLWPASSRGGSVKRAYFVLFYQFWVPVSTASAPSGTLSANAQGNPRVRLWKSQTVHALIQGWMETRL